MSRDEFTGTGTLWQDEMGIRHMRFSIEEHGVSIEVELLPVPDQYYQVFVLWRLVQSLPDLISDASQRVEGLWPREGDEG